ncbi:hypothetical protein [Actinacidiphila guanduensis]|uniref:Secreted protein n=1 Tax=Actinacidiphila guanduensis TaxID=310781 RepID=A0A1H0S2A0_9ACTN|nr:hypothetical protein [Actinacidiphila guanduensis]SDP35729.1 hypothetical protein SAMN05216259_12524 [Actinacidiphila guanduensis]
MKYVTRTRIGMAAAAVLAAGGILCTAGSASASSVPGGQLQLCSSGGFATNYVLSSSIILVQPGQCSTLTGAVGNTGSVLTVIARVASTNRYIASAQVSVSTTQGAGLQTGGTVSSPYLWSF